MLVTATAIFCFLDLLVVIGNTATISTDTHILRTGRSRLQHGVHVVKNPCSRRFFGSYERAYERFSHLKCCRLTSKMKSTRKFYEKLLLNLHLKSRTLQTHTGQVTRETKIGGSGEKIWRTEGPPTMALPWLNSKKFKIIFA